MQLSKKGTIIVIIIAALGFLILLKGGANGTSSVKDLYTTQGFEQMMEKDPSTWTKQEKEYYNSFREWSDDNR